MFCTLNARVLYNFLLLTQGYGAQGLCKFGLNEFFKDFYTNIGIFFVSFFFLFSRERERKRNLIQPMCLIVGEETVANSTVARMTLWGLASGSAEIFADIALCPFEMTKVSYRFLLEFRCMLHRTC